MTWGEFTDWLEVKARQIEGTRPQPDSWAVHDPWFDQKIAEREHRR